MSRRKDFFLEGISRPGWVQDEKNKLLKKAISIVLEFVDDI